MEEWSIHSQGFINLYIHSTEFQIPKNDIVGMTIKNYKPYVLTPKKPMFSHDFHQTAAVEKVVVHRAESQASKWRSSAFCPTAKWWTSLARWRPTKAEVVPATKVRIFYCGFHDDFIGSNGNE